MKDSLKQFQIILYIVNNDLRLSKHLYKLKPSNIYLNKFIRLIIMGYGVGPILLFALIASKNLTFTFFTFVAIVLFNFIFVEHLLKKFVKRRRPNFNNKNLRTYSFPSTHATSVTMSFFSLLIYNDLYYAPSLLLPVVLAWALFVCISRVVYGHHYLFDVIFGVLLGIALSSFFMIFKIY